MPVFATLRRFPRTFYVANVMEIFERMAWYGFFAVSSLYITGPVAAGGLGFTSEQRGVLQGVIPFILYLLPVLTGAIADKFGFKKTLAAAYLVLTPGYYLLGQPRGFWGFFFVFLLVAIGAALFKPVVIGTVSRTTNDETSSVGFGIFYLMVNIGGFLGPLVAGIVRTELGWPWVFRMSSLWIGLNLVWLFLFYDEPSHGEDLARGDRGLARLRRALGDMVEVLGNFRFFLTVFGILVLLMVAGGEWISWKFWAVASAVWLGANLAFDAALRGSGRTSARGWLAPMKIGDWRFVLYLLILAGFWAEYEQLFITLPEYLRDFTNTHDVLRSLASASGSLGMGGLQAFFEERILSGYQINPEYMVNIDSASIILFQIFVSVWVARFRPIPTMVAGTILTGVAMVMGAVSTTGWTIAAMVLVFSFGEMMASPKSQEYVSRIAPPEKAAMYMGYYFWAIALGNLFGGILSGQAYGKLARDLRRPDLMWLLFAAIAVLTGIALWLYDRRVAPRPAGNRASG